MILNKFQFTFQCIVNHLIFSIKIKKCLVALYKFTDRVFFSHKARYTRYKFCIQVSIQENLNSSLCIHDARNFDEYTQVLAGDTTKQNGIFGRRGGCYPLYCIIIYNCTAKEIKLQKEVNMGS